MSRLAKQAGLQDPEGRHPDFGVDDGEVLLRFNREGSGGSERGHEEKGHSESRHRGRPLFNLCRPGGHVYQWHSIRVEETPLPQFERIGVDKQTNPSVCGDSVLLREVNYTLDWDIPPDWRPDTVNWLGRLRGRKVENLNPLNDNHRLHKIMENGLEDGRLIRWNGRLYGLFTGHFHSGGRWTVVRNTMVLMDLETMEYRSFSTGKIEKNWMPFIEDGHLRAIYSTNPLRIVDLSGDILEDVWEGPGLTESWSGGSQLIPYQGGFLGVVHRHKDREYEHAFVALDGRSIELSPPFRFFGERVEFCAGISLDDIGLCLSFGVMDREGYLLWMAS